MRRIVSIFLTVIMILGTFSSVFASEEIYSDKSSEVNANIVDDNTPYTNGVVTVKLSETVKTYNGKYIGPWSKYYVKTDHHNISTSTSKNHFVSFSHNGISFTKSFSYTQEYSTTLSADPTRYSRPSIYGDIKMKYTTYAKKTSTGTILSRWTEADVVGKTLYIKVQYK